jgi:hypothetical protein
MPPVREEVRHIRSADDALGAEAEEYSEVPDHPEITQDGETSL